VQKKVDPTSYEKRKGRNQEEHKQSRPHSPLLDDHEKARKTGDEECQGDDAHNNLVRGKNPLFREFEEARGAIFPSQKSRG
jgi:hypothetical protein